MQLPKWRKVPPLRHFTNYFLHFFKHTTTFGMATLHKRLIDYLSRNVYLLKDFGSHYVEEPVTHATCSIFTQVNRQASVAKILLES